MFVPCPHLQDILLTLEIQAYDSHCNLVLGDVEETIYLVEEDEEGEESIKVVLPLPDHYDSLADYE